MTTNRRPELMFSRITGFSEKLDKKLRKLDNNYLFSSLGIHALIALLSQDPWFCNQDFFSNILHLDDNQIIPYYKDVLTFLSKVVIAHTSFLKHHGTAQDDFRNRLKDYFASEVNSLDFTNGEVATRTINAWFTDRTAQKLTPFDNLKDDVSLSFLNSIHYKNSWGRAFDAQQTMPAKFYVNDTSTEVQMMRKKGSFYYKEEAYLGVEVLKLPLAHDNVSLVIVLPDKGVDITEVQRCYSFLNFADLTSDMVKQEVDVSLPKFKINGSLELSSYLKTMGLEDIFSADLCGMAEGEELTCDQIKQNVYLEVNEQGVEAAGGTLSTLTQARNEKVPPEDGLIIYEAKMSAEISNRFAKVKVTWRVKNSNAEAADAKFKVVLTETAFITEFMMEIQGKTYKSYVKEKEEAKTIYNEAVEHGQSAGLVEASTRDSKEFTVSVNLEPDSVAVFCLTYEEMLQRLHDQYELVLNICPGQLVEDLSVEVNINESRPLKFVKTPPLRSGNDISTTEFTKCLEPIADIKTINSKTASIKFRPDVARQKKMTHYLGNKTNEGLYGQFVVQYDVEREPLDGEVLLQDGYFVHFFAPNDLDPLPKHVVFVLDTSGSMRGRKIKQLKDAMTNILNDLRKEDVLSIVEFNNDVVVWDVDSQKSTSFSADKIEDFQNPFPYLEQCLLVGPSVVDDSIRIKAKQVVQKIQAEGGTYMIGGLETGLQLVKVGRKINYENVNRLQPIMVFLTDGQPNVGLRSTEAIVDIVTQLNTKVNVPIFSLSLGSDADKDFLRKLSLKNLGFSRHIYEAADTSLQLQDFYKQISCPLLRDINFKYDAEVEEVTRTWFPVFFGGSELVVAGRYGEESFLSTIDCCGPLGPIVIRSVTERPVTNLERLWAFLTVKQLLDERKTSENPAGLTQKAVDLALKYSFVTDVTSLVVVKPKETTTVGDGPPTPDAPDIDCASRPFPNDRRIVTAFRNNQSFCASNKRRSSQLSPAFSPPFSSFEMCGFRKTNCGVTQSNIGVRRGQILSLRSAPMRQMCSLSLDRSDVQHYACKARRSSLGMFSGVLNKIGALFVRRPKVPETFIADRPFLVMLQYEKDGHVLVLFQGRVCRPSY